MGAGGCILCVYCTNSISRKIIWSSGWQMAQMLRKNRSQRAMNTFRTRSIQNWITSECLHNCDSTNYRHISIQHASHALYICIPVQHVYTRFGANKHIISSFCLQMWVIYIQRSWWSWWWWLFFEHPFCYVYMFLSHHAQAQIGFNFPQDDK